MLVAQLQIDQLVSGAVSSVLYQDTRRIYHIVMHRQTHVGQSPFNFFLRVFLQFVTSILTSAKCRCFFIDCVLKSSYIYTRFSHTNSFFCLLANYYACLPLSFRYSVLIKFQVRVMIPGCSCKSKQNVFADSRMHRRFNVCTWSTQYIDLLDMILGMLF